MTTTLMPLVKQQFSQNGVPVAGGKLFVYLAGTTNKATTYTDSTGDAPNTNPINLDANGQASVWLDPTVFYKFVLSPSTDTDPPTNPYWTVDNVAAPAPVAVGNMTDEKGSGGTPGFAANVDFTPGTTESLTLSNNYGSAENIWVTFDGLEQGPDTYSLGGADNETLTFNAPIPVGVNKVYVKGGTALTVSIPASGSVTDSTVSGGAAIQSWKLSFLQNGVGAVVRSVQSKESDLLSVKDFGAKGDGVTDDTLAIMTADAVARLIGKRTYLPGAVYMASQFVVNIGSSLYGDGRNNTIIRQIAGSNVDLIYGVNSNANWGVASPSPTGFAYNFDIRDLTLDGNCTAFSNTTYGSGIAIYGSRFRIRDVDIKNCAEYGMRTEYSDANWDYTQPWYEASVSGVRVQNVGKHGWLCNGPHDLHTFDVSIIDASRLGNNLWDGLYIDTNMSGRWLAVHCSNSNQSIRHRYAVNINGNGNQFGGGCNFEGAYSGNVRLAAQDCQFDPTCNYYAAWNGNNFVMDGQCSLNQIHGNMGGPVTGQPACIGIVFASTASSVNDNLIDVTMSGQEAAPIAFNGTVDGGYNDIRIKAFSSTGPGVYGTPNTAGGTRLKIDSHGGTSYYIDTSHQTTELTFGGTGSVTWTYPFPFQGKPALSVSVENPGASITSTPWSTGTSNTAATFFNNNATSLTLVVTASLSSY